MAWLYQPLLPAAAELESGPSVGPINPAYWVGGSGTWNATDPTNWAATSGGSGGAGYPDSNSTVYFDGNSGVGTVTIDGGVCNDFNISSGVSAITLAPSTSGLTIYGNATVSSTNATISGSAAITFAATSSKTITSGGETFDCPVTFNGSGGTWTLQDNLTIGSTRTTTLTNGTLDLNGNTISTGIFNSSNSNARTLTSATTAQIVITYASVSTTVWNTGTITNLTGSNNITVLITGNDAITKTINAGTLSESNAFSFTVGGNGSTITFTTSNVLRNLTVTNTTCTISNVSLTIYGNLDIQGNNPNLGTGNNTWTFAATSGTKTLTTNGERLDYLIVFNGVGGTWQIIDSLIIGGISSPKTLRLTNGTLDLNGKTCYTDLFDSNNSNTRSLISSTPANIYLTNGSVNGAYVWNILTNTGYTGSNNITVNITGNDSITKIIATGQNSISGNDACNFVIGGNGTTFDLAGDMTVKNLTITNTTCSFSSAFAVTIYGNLTIGGTNPTLGTFYGWNFFSTSSQTITTNGKTLDIGITFNGAGGTWQLQDTLTVGATRTIRLTNGTLDLNNFTLNTGTFSSNNSNTRSIAFGTGNITIVRAGGIAWDTSTVTGLTVSGTPNVVVSYSGATALTINTGFQTESNSINYYFSTGTYSLSLFTGTNSRVKSLNFTGFSGSLANPTGSAGIYGDLVMSPTMSFGAWTTSLGLAGTTGTQNITTNSVTLPFSLAMVGPAKTVVLQDNLTLESTRTFFLNNGTLNLNGKTLTTGTLFQVGLNATTAAITFNGGTIVCPGSGTVFNNLSPSVFTSSPGTSPGKISLTSASAKTFAGNDSTYNCTLENAGAGALTISGSNTFDNITNSVSPATFTFTAGTTTTVNNFNVSGTAGNVVTINSTGAAFTLSKAGGTVSVSYCTISNSTATGGATWQAYTTNGNTDGGGNTGWLFAPLVVYVTIDNNVVLGAGILISF